MALIPKVEPKQEKKVVSARLDEEAHTMLQRYAASRGDLANLAANLSDENLFGAVGRLLGLDCQ